MNDRLTRLSHIHHQWVAEMGWHNKTELEALALVASEIGEAARDLEQIQDGVGPATPHTYTVELADIVLRIVDMLLLRDPCMFIGERVQSAIVEALVDPDAEPGRALGRMYSHLALAINICRTEGVSLKAMINLLAIIRQCYQAAAWMGCDLLRHIEDKIELNRQRGTRGRPV